MSKYLREMNHGACIVQLPARIRDPVHAGSSHEVPLTVEHIFVDTFAGAVSKQLVWSVECRVSAWLFSTVRLAEHGPISSSVSSFVPY